MKKLMLLLAAGSLWLFLAAVPVLADGGPHVADENNGATTLTTDSCAGCHRAHTAQGAFLLKVPEEQLCASCHGDEGTGASTDVWSGVQYALGTDGFRDEDVEIGALRAGGFEFTRLGDPFKKIDPTGEFAKVTATDGASPAAVTSAHIPGIGGLTPTGVAWGNGANGADDPGPTASVTCGSCHNVHGNDQYRILKRVPDGSGVDPVWVVDVFDYGVFAANTYRTVASHGLLVGDVVTVAGMTGDGDAVDATVLAVGNDTRFTLTGNPGGAGTGTGGTVERVSDEAVDGYGVKVTDNPPATDIPDGDARNYTVIQTLASAPSFFASDADDWDPTDGDYFHYRVPWDASGTLNVDYNYDAPNGEVGTAVFSSGRWSVRTGDRSFGQEITAWCSSCHTRYWAWSQPTTDPPDGTTGAAYNTARPDDNIFTFQHRTRGSSGRGCLTCHVSHGTSKTMTGLAATVPLPGQVAGSANSRLLKVDNRGTCQLCHDETESTVADGVYGPNGLDTDPGRP